MASLAKSLKSFSLGQWLGWICMSFLLLGLILSSPQSETSPHILLFLIAVLGLMFCLGSAWFCLQMAFLTLFTGILTALPIGFTLKGPQIFVLLGLSAWILSFLRRDKTPGLSYGWVWPFIGFVLCILPSFLMVEQQQLVLGKPETALRLLLNYGWLQLFTLLILLEVHNKTRLLQVLKWAGLSFLLSLAFGYAQQVGFYSAYYDPVAWIGKHSSIVDFYGPFLRLSPGTFANEYGEILQTMGILWVGWIYLQPKPKRAAHFILLAVIMLSLLINFTRASWLVFFMGAFLVLVLSGLRFWALTSLLCLGTATLGLLFYLSHLILQASVLLSIGQRFTELGQLQTHSAGERLLSWDTAWRAFLNSPWIGNGWGLYVGTHNVPLELLAETGLLGCLAFYALMFWCAGLMYAAWRQSLDPELKALQISLLVAFLGCLAFDLTNHGIYHFVLWFCLGLGLACARIIFEGHGSKIIQLKLK